MPNYFFSRLLSILLLAFIYSPFNYSYSQEKNPTIEWSVLLDGYSCSFPCKDGNFIYVGSESCKVVCIDILNGKITWEYFTTTTKTKTRKGAVLHKIICDEENIYFNDCGISLFALDKKSGTLKWRFDFNNSNNELVFDDDILANPTINGNNIIVNTISSVAAINKSTGKLNWSYAELNSNYVVSTNIGCIALTNDKIYVGTSDNVIISLNSLTGKVLNKIKTSCSIRTLQLVANNEYIVVASCNSKRDSLLTTQCYSVKKGKLVWKK